MWTVVDYEYIELTGTTAVGFTASKLTPSTPPPEAALCQAGTAEVIVGCGVAPTYSDPSTGILVYPRGVFIVTGLPDLRSFGVVKFGANSGLQVQYLR